MNAPTKDCDHRRIDDFLDSNRVGLEDEQLLEHLNTCTACPGVCHDILTLSARVLNAS